MLSLVGAKGGSGASVVATMIAVGAAAAREECLLVDLDGSLPSLLGVATNSGPGALDWLLAGAQTPPEGLRRLECTVGARLSLLPLGEGSPGALGQSFVERVDTMLGVLRADGRRVVIDGGSILAAGPTHLQRRLISTCPASVVVTRACYLALTRLVGSGLRPGGIVLIREAGRSLGRRDLEAVTGRPVVATFDQDPVIARAADAGLLTRRLPRGTPRAVESLLRMDSDGHRASELGSGDVRPRSFQSGPALEAVGSESRNGVDGTGWPT